MATSSPLRILLYSEYYHPMVGGLEVFAAALAGAFVGRGHTVHLLTCRVDKSWPAEEVVDGIPITRIPWLDAFGTRSPSDLLTMLNDVSALMRSVTPTAVLLNGIGPGALLLCRTLDAATATIAVPQISLAPNQRTGPGTLLHEVLARSDWVVAPAQSVLDELLSVIPGLSSRSSVIPDSHGREVEPRPIPWNQPTLLCFGRLERVKGFDVALEAFAQVAVGHPAVRLVIAGKGGERDALEAQASRLGVADRVTFEGFVSEARARALRDDACIVLMPSRLEGFGIVALEAARAARPVIASRIPGLQDVVVDGETGVLIPANSSAALAAAIDRLLRDRGRTERLGLRGRERASSHFAWSPTVVAYEDLIRGVGKTPRA